MANLILGLDLGTASLGWALLDEKDESLYRCGVRIFPEGVDRDTKGAELSKNEKRRLARSHRRLLRRRSARKRKLKSLLVEAGLLPEVVLAPRKDSARQDWEKNVFKQADPYELRKKGLDEPLEPHEVGRALLHLSQRRGFLSNRKADREKKKETEGLLGEISDLENKIQESGSRTLGEYLADLRSKNPQEFHLTRIRGRHTRRSMFETEFDAIWNAQQKHHSNMMTDELRDKLHNQIFFQRPIKPPSPGMIGRCEVIPRLARCPRADRRAQRFRIYMEVNNLNYIDLSRRQTMDLSPEQRVTLIEYLMTGKERSFDQIRKKLFPQHDNIRFNLERGDRKKLLGMPVDAILSKKEYFNKKWSKIDEDIKDWIVAAIIDDDESRLRSLLEDADFDPEMAETLLDNVPLPEGYSSYSLHAIKKMLPFVEKGMPLLSRDSETPCAYREAGFLPPWEREGEKSRLLGETPDVTNPIVRAALREVKKVVNSILREIVFKEGHTLTRIRIELAREAKGTARQREQRTKDMRQNEKKRDEAKKWLEENKHRPSHDAILRYQLWKQQGEMCIYSGSTITPGQLFGGDIDIDHILPYGKSNDNSQMNKVVCFRSENSKGASRNAKGDLTPYEWLAEAVPDKYDQVIQRAKKLPYSKLKRFYQKEVDVDDFIARQLRDTTYITTQVRLYVECLGAKVDCVKGIHTATIRHRLGLGTILREMTDSPAWQAAQDLAPGEKNRLDHRHHTIDAVVVALTNHSRMQALAGANRMDQMEQYGLQLDAEQVHQINKKLDPKCGLSEFRHDVSDMVSKINVSYRVRRKASGQLHEETVYGKTETEGEFVVRKDLTALTPSMIEVIRDPVVRKKVIDHLRKHGVEIGRKKVKISPDVWKDPLWMNEEKGIRINKVRIVKRDQTIESIREGTAYVKPGNTHHFCLFEYVDKKGKKKITSVFVTMIEAMGRVRKKESVIQRAHPEFPEAKFLFSLSSNEMLRIEHKDKTELYQYITAASTSKQMWFKHHCAGGKAASKIGEISKMPGSLIAKKVTVDPIGQIRWAND